MIDSIASRGSQSEATSPAISGFESRLLALKSQRGLLLLSIASVLLCSAHAAIARLDTARAAGFGYLVLVIVFTACSCAFWTRAASAPPTLYIRWTFLSAGAFAAAMGYFPSFINASFNAPPMRQFQTACFNASEALYMLAALLFCAGATKSIVFADVLQALLFSIIRFNLLYSPVTRDHFAMFHLVLTQLVAFFLFLVAMVACFGAASRSEMKLLQTLSWFLGLRFIAFFLADQVNYTWLHHNNCGLFDVPGPALLACFSLYLFYTRHSVNAEQSSAAPFLTPSVTVRNLMPSFLTFVNLMFGLLLLKISLRLAASAISLSVICYVARTAMLQAQAIKEKASLQRRNEQLEGLATRDPLTGIGNRRSLSGVYDNLQAADNCESLSLLLMDIDHFKQANDSNGHLYGDKVLVVLAKKLDELAMKIPGSHAARFGGDEFALLLPALTSESAAALAEELRASFHGHAFESETGQVSLSIGVVSLESARSLPLEQMICHADRALYRAKLLGRNRVEILSVHDAVAAADPAPALPMGFQAG